MSTDISDEQMNALIQAEPTEVPIERAATFGESIDFRKLYRVKKHKELFFPVSAMQKNGVVGMCSISGSKTISPHRNDLECLADFTFHKNDRSKINMVQVFDNLHAVPEEKLKEMKTEELMLTAVPGYDAEKFKPFHAEKVLGWYLELKKINPA